MGWIPAEHLAPEASRLPLDQPAPCFSCGLRCRKGWGREELGEGTRECQGVVDAAGCWRQQPRRVCGGRGHTTLDSYQDLSQCSFCTFYDSLQPLGLEIMNHSPELLSWNSRKDLKLEEFLFFKLHGCVDRGMNSHHLRSGDQLHGSLTFPRQENVKS